MVERTERNDLRIDKLTQEQLQMLNQLSPWIEWTSKEGAKKTSTSYLGGEITN